MPNIFRSRFEGDFATGLIGRTEFTELSSLPGLPLNLDILPTFLDQVGDFVASRTRRPLSLMESFTKDVVSPVHHIGRLQRLQVSQQTAWEEGNFFGNLMRTEAVADDIIASRMEYLIRVWFNR